jgi:predicted DNA-binding transcriptional regulator AlpA
MRQNGSTLRQIAKAKALGVSHTTIYRGIGRV